MKDIDKHNINFICLALALVLSHIFNKKITIKNEIKVIWLEEVCFVETRADFVISLFLVFLSLERLMNETKWEKLSVAAAPTCSCCGVHGDHNEHLLS